MIETEFLSRRLRELATEWRSQAARPDDWRAKADLLDSAASLVERDGRGDCSALQPKLSSQERKKRAQERRVAIARYLDRHGPTSCCGLAKAIPALGTPSNAAFIVKKCHWFQRNGRFIELTELGRRFCEGRYLGNGTKPRPELKKALAAAPRDPEQQTPKAAPRPEAKPKPKTPQDLADERNRRMLVELIRARGGMRPAVICGALAVTFETMERLIQHRWFNFYDGRVYVTNAATVEVQKTEPAGVP